MPKRLYEKFSIKTSKQTYGMDLQKASYDLDLIFISSGSLCFLTNLDEAKTSLQEFHNHLNTNGIFLFEIETLKSITLKDVWCKSVWHKQNNQKIILTQFTSMQGGICNTMCKCELIETSKFMRTESEKTKIRIYAPNTPLTKILKSARFNQIRTLKIFDLNQQPNEQDESIVYECKK